MLSIHRTQSLWRCGVGIWVQRTQEDTEILTWVTEMKKRDEREFSLGCGEREPRGDVWQVFGCMYGSGAQWS